MQPSVELPRSTAPRSRRDRLWEAIATGPTLRLLAVLAAVGMARGLSWALRAPALTFDLPSARRVIEVASWNAVGSWMAWAPVVVALVAAVNLAPPQGIRRLGTLAGVVVASVAFGAGLRLGFGLLTGTGPPLQHAFLALVGTVPRSLALATLLGVGLEFLRRAQQARALTRQVEIDRMTLERDLSESRLLLLQAQVEPHFLFNTLAHVRRLLDTDPPRGRQMLDSFMDYAAWMLPQLRRGETTLGDELAAVHAYLRIQQIRMGPRLKVELDVPPRLVRHVLPPMMILTLVENAIKHGIGPSRQGGVVRVSAAVEGDAAQARLQVTVEDSGVGFAPGSGSGLGLANIRGRLLAQYGSRASLQLRGNEAGGLTAVLDLPAAEPGADGVDGGVDGGDRRARPLAPGVAT